MIQPLRRVHQWVVIGLAVVLLAIFTAGLAVRQPSPPLSKSLPIRSPAVGKISELHSFQRVLAPDVLIYWARTSPSGTTLPLDARLLGSLHGTQSLNFPQVSDGYLLTYSLPDRRVVAYVPVSTEVSRP